MPQGQQSEEFPKDATLEPIIHGGIITPSGAASITPDNSTTGEKFPEGATLEAIQEGTKLSTPAGWHTDASGQPVVNDNEAYPLSTSPDRFMGNLNEQLIGARTLSDVPKMLKSLTDNPLTGKPFDDENGYTDINGIKVSNRLGHLHGILSAPANIAKGIITSSGSASQSGLDQLKQPGISNKTAGVLKYVIGGVPVAGPAIVKSMDAFERGDYAGGLGTLSGIGLQAIMGNPSLHEAIGARLDAAGKYLFSKPKVQQTILGGEAQEALTHVKSLAKAETESAYQPINQLESNPSVTVPGHRVADSFNSALHDNMKGTSTVPTPMREVVNEGGLKSIGYIPNAQGQLREIFSHASPDTPVSLKDLHGYYSELGEFMDRGNLPGDIYNTAKQARQSIGDMIADVYKEHSTPGTTDLYNKWEDAQRLWSDYAIRFLDPDSPLKKAIDEANPYNHLKSADRPAATLAHLTGDNETLARSYLNRYRHLGANDDIVSAAVKLAKGMNQMQLRGLLQASGGLLLSYMLRSEGMPGAVGAGAAMTLLGRRLAMGYVNTRPTLTGLLSQMDVPPSSWRAFPLSEGGIGGGGSRGVSGISGPKPPRSPVPSGNPTPFPPINSINSGESSLLSSILNHPSLSPELKADIKSIIEGNK